jgi:hypothetical protein
MQNMNQKGAKVVRALLNLIATVGYNWYKHIRELCSVINRYDLYTKKTSVLVRLYVEVLVLVFDGPETSLMFVLILCYKISNTCIPNCKTLQ